MKKTISINIAGLIFYIEEDGYDKLRQYIASVHRYFSSFADSTEIVADIEGRMAERFLQKQKNDNKQAISLEDVDELIVAMGNVSDFEAVEQAEDLISEPLNYASDNPAGETRTTRSSGGKFFRDLRRKIIGGVASGIAHYYAIDPLWVRLILLLVVFGLVPLSGIFNLQQEGSFVFLGGMVLLGYIAMWIAFPGSIHLEDKEKIKKFYRDQEDKVLGGVASGLGSYFGIDTGVVRFLWVISIFFFGTGILAYVILWAIAPRATTLTEKMEMHGEPITLSNIESNIKRNLNAGVEKVKDGGLQRIALLPFKILGSVLNALGKVMRELAPLLRVLIGILMVAIGGMGLLTLLVCGAALLGFWNMSDFGVLPTEFLILKETPGVLLLSVVTLLAVPVLVVLLLGLTLVLNRKLVGSTVWIMLAGLTVFSIVGGISSGLVFQRNFSELGEFSERSGLPLGSGTLLLDAEEGYNRKHIAVGVRLKEGLVEDTLLLETRFFARGANRLDAREVASHVQYTIEKTDSVLRLPVGPLKSETLPFREQRVEVDLEIPYHTPFVMTRNFFFRNLIHDAHVRKVLNDFNLRDDALNWANLRWQFLPDSGLVCLNIPERFKAEKKKVEESGEFWVDKETFGGVRLGTRGEFVKQFVVPEFSGINCAGAFDIEVKKDEEFSVTLHGTENDVDAFLVKVTNGVLHVEKRDNAVDWEDSNRRVGIIITLPSIQSINLSGSDRAVVSGFDQLKRLSVQLSGASSMDMQVGVQRAEMNLEGASKMLIKGRFDELEATLSGACHLEARQASINQAKVSAAGTSKAILGKIAQLETDESGASLIRTEK